MSNNTDESLPINNEMGMEVVDTTSQLVPSKRGTIISTICYENGMNYPSLEFAQPNQTELIQSYKDLIASARDPALENALQPMPFIVRPSLKDEIIDIIKNTPVHVWYAVVPLVLVLAFSPEFRLVVIVVGICYGITYVLQTFSTTVETRAVQSINENVLAVTQNVNTTSHNATASLITQNQNMQKYTLDTVKDVTEIRAGVEKVRIASMEHCHGIDREVDLKMKALSEGGTTDRAKDENAMKKHKAEIEAQTKKEMANAEIEKQKEFKKVDIQMNADQIRKDLEIGKLESIYKTETAKINADIAIKTTELSTKVNLDKNAVGKEIELEKLRQTTAQKKDDNEKTVEVARVEGDVEIGKAKWIAEMMKSKGKVDIKWDTWKADRNN
ncbi:uncharacterized protein LOC110858107 [Folsomia candida]|uniref:uncharacterized protein LOC110858107 n=1 Tax=Folsomia candida TaxID=158441 RepID=UPI000B906EF4|nr:uncharacterized protein LOC110858107 [Folsomia candida]